VLDPTSGPRNVPAGGRDLVSILSVRALSKSFKGGSRVLENIDLDVGAGEAVALIGANGAGKSTLVRCLLRLVEPTGGDIRFFGLDVCDLKPGPLRRLRSRVGFVFQRHNLVLRLSALSNVIHGAQAKLSGPSVWYQALASREIRERALACLDRVGMADKADARVDALSGGQSQRVAIARMLMQQPDFVVADEPDASLDPSAGEQVMQLLRDTTRESGVGLLFISHDLEHTVQFSDRVVGLARGHVAINIPAHEIDPANLRGFFAEARRQ
jgi:phosphonate transport system ATP-binding protein